VSAGPSARRSLADRWAKSPGLGLAALILTVVAGLVAVVTLGLDVFDRLATAPTASASATGTANAPTAAAQTAAGEPSPFVSGRSGPTVVSVCLDDQQKEIDCREPHHLEKLGGSCSTGGMLIYMSGRAGLDVALADVRPLSTACVIDNPVEVVETAAGVLAGSNDDSWRRCLDDQRGRLVPCSEDHTGEYIATGEARKANQVECERAAEAYLNQTLANVGDLLTVRVVAEVDRDPNSPRCLIAVRGSQPLTASVRNLGVGPVPIRR
jgi:hypothetical protein